METLPLNPNPSKIKIFPILEEALNFFVGQWDKLWKWIVLGGVLHVLPALLIFFWEVNEEGEWVLTSISVGIYYLLLAITMIPWGVVFVLMAVYCHRTILVDSFLGGKGPRFFFTPRERTFFLWSIVLYVVVFLLTIAMSVGGGLLAAGLMSTVGTVVFLEPMLKSPFMVRILIEGFAVLFWYFFGRWSLIFPVVAVDGDPSLGWSWKQTKGNGWRIGFLVWVFPILAAITSEQISLFWEGTELGLWFLIKFLSSLAWVLITPIEVAVISIAFRELTNWNAVRQEVSV